MMIHNSHNIQRIFILVHILCEIVTPHLGGSIIGMILVALINNYREIGSNIYYWEIIVVFI